jgi:hypothetical protein
MKNQINSTAVRKEVQAAREKGQSVNISKKNSTLLLVAVALWVGVMAFALIKYANQ